MTYAIGMVFGAIFAALEHRVLFNMDKWAEEQATNILLDDDKRLEEILGSSSA